MSPFSFSKYQGLGNDFVVVDLRQGEPSPSPNTAEAARVLCDRHFGVGADGILAILPAQGTQADARMRILNADGSEAEMCGNGLRCVVKQLYEHDPRLHKSPLRIETGNGVLSCAVIPAADGTVASVAVEMGRPRVLRGELPMTGPEDQRCLEQPLDLAGREFRVTAVSMGNPHAVCFVDASGASLRALAESHGPALERHSSFPRRTNAEFVRVVSATELELVVWERGCGVTLACGTGACATAVAACLTGRAQPETEIVVRLLGGPLSITVAKDYAGVTMRGPARRVYEATLDLAPLLAV
jgi:diaminopimelate epimerase